MNIKNHFKTYRSKLRFNFLTQFFIYWFIYISVYLLDLNIILSTFQIFWVLVNCREFFIPIQLISIQVYLFIELPIYLSNFCYQSTYLLDFPDPSKWPVAIHPYPVNKYSSLSITLIHLFIYLTLVSIYLTFWFSVSQ